MRKLRNKNRLTFLTIAFAVLFSIGAVFASLDGVLDIEGRISVAGSAEDVLAWTETISHFANADGNTFITTPPALGSAPTRIAWNIEFAEAGVATLAATATNHGLSRFDIEGAEYWWVDEDGTIIPGSVIDNDFGFVVRINESLFIGVVEAGEESGPLGVEVEWFGDLPDDFRAARGTGNFVDAPVGFAATLVIEFRYVRAP